MHTQTRACACVRRAHRSLGPTISGAVRVVSACVKKKGRSQWGVPEVLQASCWALLLHWTTWNRSLPHLNATSYLEDWRRDVETISGAPADRTAHQKWAQPWFPVPSGCLLTPAMGEWTILERLLEAAVQQHSTMIGRWALVRVTEVFRAMLAQAGCLSVCIKIGTVLAWFHDVCVSS